VHGVSMWVDFQYERLPRFCFNCGVVKHGVSGCMKKAQGGGAEYGAWLRAPLPEKRIRSGLAWKRGREEADPSHHGVGSTNSNTGGKNAGRPSMVVDTESGESLVSETPPVGVKWAEAPTRESFHVSANHRVTGKGGNDQESIVREENQERPENLGGGSKSSKKGADGYGKEYNGQSDVVNEVLNGEDLWGSIGNGMQAQKEELRKLTGNRKNAQKEGSDDVLHERADVQSGKGMNVEKGADVWDGNGKNMNLRQWGPCVVMIGSNGFSKGQQGEARVMRKNTT
jgi:hypothetical protein